MPKLIEVRENRTLSVIIEGEQYADKTLFLLHGLGGRAAQWRELIPLLSQTYRVIAPDFFGQGNSFSIKESTAYGFDELLKDILALFDRFKSKKNAVIGHSYGGAFATQLCLQRKGEINCLTLLAPMPCRADYPVPLVYCLPVFLMECLRPLLIHEFKKRAFSKHAPQTMREDEIKAIQDNPFWVAKALIQGIKTTPVTLASDLNLPCLLVITTEDSLVLPKDQRAFYQGIPNVELVELPTGHIVMLEQPQAVNHRLRNFLNNYLDTDGMSTMGSTSAE